MTEDFLNDDLLFSQIEDELNREKGLYEDNFFNKMSPIACWSEKESTPEAIEKRLAKIKDDFWAWDKTYFPPDAYDEYKEPGFFHKELYQLTTLKDKIAHIVMGPRDTAKTSLFKRIIIYNMIYGLRKYIGFGSGTLVAPEQFIYDVEVFLRNNPRINTDYKLKIKQAPGGALHVISDVRSNPMGSFLEPISEKRTTRGGSKNLLDRYDMIIVTDLESLMSSLDPDKVQNRIDKIDEMRSSLSRNGVLIAEGNNFDIRTAMNQMRIQETKGILPNTTKLHVYKAWDSTRKGYAKSIWYARFPAKSEDEMRKLMKVKDDYDWAGNYQQTPKQKGADIFPPEYYAEWNTLPNDLKSIMYNDPNLSKKLKGDTTTAGALAFSASEQKFYVLPHIICKPYSDSNKLIEDFISIRDKLKEMGIYVRAMLFDGNVSQESQWTQHVLNYSKLKNIPVPPIDYKHYKVDDLTKNAETIWKQNSILFPPNFKDSEMGERFYNQLIGFAGKKAGKKDDAPDWLICAIEGLHELHLVSYAGAYKLADQIHTVKRKNGFQRF
jgi:hypothetical protein